MVAKSDSRRIKLESFGEELLAALAFDSGLKNCM
jgi:hypothetical protein